jgi:HK97 family phage major capsid protein
MPDLNQRLTELRERRGELHSQMEDIHKRGVEEQRSLTDEERTRFDNLHQQVLTIDDEHDRVMRMIQLSSGTPVPRAGNDGNVHDLVRRCSLFRAIRHLINGSEPDGPEAEWQAEQLRQAPRSVQGLLFPLREQRAIAVATGSTGGYLVEETLRDELLIEPLRKRTVTGQLGATILPDLVGDQTIPKQSGVIAGQWVAENQELSEESPTFSQVRLAPKHVGSYSEATRQAVIQGTPSVEEIIRRDLENQLNIAIDSAALNGSGVGAEPLGILNTSGINVATEFAADTPTWAEVNAVIGELDADDALMGSLGFAMHPTMIANLRVENMDSGSGRFVVEGNPPMAASYRIATSTLVPYATGASNLVFGNWQDLLIGLWSGVDILVNPYESTAFKKGNVLIRGFQTCDIAVRHAESFVRGHHTA